MKKLFYCALTLALAFSLTSCGGKKQVETPPEPQDVTTEKFGWTIVERDGVYGIEDFFEKQYAFLDIVDSTFVIVGDGQTKGIINLKSKNPGKDLEFGTFQDVVYFGSSLFRVGQPEAKIFALFKDGKVISKEYEEITQDGAKIKAKKGKGFVFLNPKTGKEIKK